MRRLNISLNEQYFKMLETINQVENKGLVKPGTFARKLLIDNLEEKIKTVTREKIRKIKKNKKK